MNYIVNYINIIVTLILLILKETKNIEDTVACLVACLKKAKNSWGVALPPFESQFKKIFVRFFDIWILVNQLNFLIFGSCG